MKLKLKNGYYMVNLREKKNVPRTYLVHRLVASTFIDNWDENCIVDHIDGIRTNNHIDNLRITSTIGNAIYKNNNQYPIQNNL